MHAEGDPTLPLPGLSAVCGKPVSARFDGGRLSSDGGILLLAEVERRLENLPGPTALKRMMAAMVELFCDSFDTVPGRIVLDIDDTEDRVHGGQQLALLNAHHDSRCFMRIPMMSAGHSD